MSGCERGATTTHATSVAAPPAPVELLAVSKHYDGFQAVADVSLNVNAGEFLTLLGPSGSGKTTTLMLVAGFQAVDQGTIMIGGESVTDVPPYDRNLGFVFQHYALFPHLSVAENLAFPLKVRGVDPDTISKRVAETLSLVMLPGHEDRMPTELSGGQQQRVALARALIFRPPVLLMDEPLSALDKRLRQQMQLEIKRIQRSLNVTVIYVTHDQEEALTMSDRIAVMNQGRVAQVATPEEIYEKPADGFVADFIGETNFLIGVAGRGSDGESRLTTDDQAVWPLGPSAAVGVGQRVKVALRPEKLQVRMANTGEEDRPAPGLRSVTGLVEDIVYLGDQCKYAVRVQDHLLTCKELANAGSNRFQPGHQVEVAWRDEDVRVLPA